MLRIIAKRDAQMRWRAWWKDLLREYQTSGSMLDAVKVVHDWVVGYFEFFPDVFISNERIRVYRCVSHSQNTAR